MKKRVIFAILTMGLSGIIAQILLLRELLVTFHGNELSLGIILANWLILEAIGAFFLGKRAEHVRKKLEVFIGLAIIFSLSLPLAIYLTRILKEIIGVPIGQGLGPLSILFASFFILLPVSISHGALFTFGCKVFSLFSKQEDAANIAKVYIYETLGTIAGGIGLTYLFIPYLHSFQIALGVALLNFFVCMVLLGSTYKVLPDVQTLTSKILASLSLIFVLLTAFLIFSGGADRIHWRSIRSQWKGQEVVHYENSLYGNIIVTKREEQHTFFSDGIPIITIPTPNISFVEEFVHLPMLSHPQPKDILVIGGGAGGIINEALKHPSLERLDYAELDPLILEVVKKFPAPVTEVELSDPRVNIEHIDGRLFVKTTPHKYDLVLVGLSNPSDLQTNRLFTKEFFSLVKKKLKEKGILVMSLPGSLTYLSEELRNLNACILNALKSIYPYVWIIPGDSTNLFFSSESAEISLINHTKLSQRLKERGFKTTLLTPGHIEYKLHPRRLTWFLNSLKGATLKINQDFKPSGPFYSLLYWNAAFSPSTRALFAWFEKVNLRLIIILLSIFTLMFLIIRPKLGGLSRAGIPLCIATSGFAGMIFELVLIFTFQALYGYVFGWMGLLVTAFMVGVAVGSLAMMRALGRDRGGLALFLKIELAIILFSAILPGVFLALRPYLDRPAVFFIFQIIFLVLSFLAGALIGAEFPLANKIYLRLDAKHKRQTLSGTAGLLYSLDLFGGWLGGIVGGVILLPVLGLMGTCVVVIMFKLCSLTVLFTSINKNKVKFS